MQTHEKPAPTLFSRERRRARLDAFVRSVSGVLVTHAETRAKREGTPPREVIAKYRPLRSPKR